MVNVTRREVWGMIKTTDCGEDKVTSRGAGFDLSRYASSFDEEPLGLHHNRGEESSTDRHRWQTAVAFIRSRSVLRNAAARANVSGGILLTGARQFLVFLVFLSIAESLETMSSICTRPESVSHRLQIAVASFEPARMLQRRSDCQTEFVITWRSEDTMLYLRVSAISSNFFSMVSRSCGIDTSGPGCVIRADGDQSL